LKQRLAGALSRDVDIVVLPARRRELREASESRLYHMVRERGYPGRPDHFRAIVARHRPRPVAEAYLRLRTLQADQGQVDWAHFGKLTVGRVLRPLMAFVMVLSYSRHLFVRFYLGAAMSSFLDGHVRAFSYNGVVRTLLYDNLRSSGCGGASRM